jgi:class 3 adenylate cyclase/predicted negative regulator of RcsB-dependent stress response
MNEPNGRQTDTAAEESSATLAEAREAFERQDWQRSYELLREAAAASDLRGGDLRRLAEAAFWTGRHDESLKTLERAFTALAAEGNMAAAGMTALEVARERQNRVEFAVAAGWSSRATTLLESVPESGEYGYLVLARASGALGEGNLDRARELAEQAVEIARRHGDRDLEALAVQRLGGVLLAQGEVTRGLALVDEATLSAVAGELRTMTTAVVYCRTISHCQELADFRRAGEWTEAAAQWCELRSVTGFPGVCRVHRADIMRFRGAWAEAEAEARRACEELQGFDLAVVGEAFYEIGEVRFRFGDFDAAEDAFREAHRLGREPQPGLALLRLARGDVAAASAAIRRAVEDETWDRLARARLLPALVEIALANDEVEAARSAAEELDTIAGTYGSPAIQAAADHAHGAVLLRSGDSAEAVRRFKRALLRWREVDAPYDAARVRVALAGAYRLVGDEGGAALELGAARAAFESLGARADLERVESILAETVAAGSKAAPERATMTFMFTDIVRSTALVEAFGDSAWANLLRWHDQTLRSLFAAHGGREINHTGDGFFVGFEDPQKGIDCAVAIQRSLAAHRRDHGFAPEVRIGVHTAEVARRGRDFGGRGVHEAARIAALAGGGEILASRDSLIEGKSPYQVSPPRAASLQGFSEPVEVVAIDWSRAPA